MSSRRTGGPARTAIGFLVLCATAAPNRAQSGAMDQSFTEARRWTAAKFLGTIDPMPTMAYLMVYTKSGRVAKNRIGGRTFRIHDREFNRGLAMTSLGEVSVRLPSPGSHFEAVVGVDSNDLGYYSNAGRGNVVATVEVGGREAFRSPVLREGLAGIPVDVHLAGAREFKLRLAAAGERPRTHQAVWDQADWAQARVTLADGSTLWLADLPVGPLPRAFSTEPPYSFRYGRRPSSDLLPLWPEQRTTRQLDQYRTEYTVSYTDPKTGLLVRSVAVAYRDFPTVEWTLYFKNTSAASTPILEDIDPLDTGWQRNNDGEFVLHHSRGSPNSPADYEPLETVLLPKAEQRISARGGRPTDTDLCYFNLDWSGSGVILALGWPGQWSALFTRDEGNRLRVRAGQELTHFRLLPGEEVRTPLVALQFWHGDWLGAQNTWRRWMVAHNVPRPGGKLPPPQLADSSGRQTVEMQEANEENQKAFLQRDLDAGLQLDYWWMDAGWYPFKTGWWNTGTWEPDPQRFPHGLAPISAAAHARGVKIIVWFHPSGSLPVRGSTRNTRSG